MDTEIGLQCLNGGNCKLWTWMVRVLHPRALQYTYFDKRQQKQVKATKFECYLVGKNPQKYVMASIRHNPRDLNFVESEHQRFANGTVWKLSCVALVTNALPQYNGAPNKNVVSLEAPTQMVAILMSSPEEQSISKFIAPKLRLPDLLQVGQTLTLDACVYVASCESVRRELVKGQSTEIATATLAQGTFEAQVSCWGPTAQIVHDLVKSAVVVIGMGASVSDRGVKLSLRDSSIIDAGKNDHLIELAALMPTESGVAPVRTSVTASLTSAGGKVIDMTGQAVLSCAAIVDVFKNMEEPTTELLQLMGVRLECSIQQIHTQDGSRLYLTGYVRDWSGSVAVTIVESAIIQLFGCSSRIEVEAKHVAKELEKPAGLLNIRGVLRNKDFQMHCCMAMPPYQLPTSPALKLAEVVTMCGPFRDGILPCRNTDIHSNGFVNLGIHYGGTGSGVAPSTAVSAPHQVMMLVQGSEKTKLQKARCSTHVRVMESQNVRCIGLESDELSVTTFTLRAVCHENDLLEFLLDTNSALVWISAVAQSDEPKTFVVDHLEKVSSDMIPAAISYMLAMIQLASSPRSPVDASGIMDGTSPHNFKRAKLFAYPSNPSEPVKIL